MMTNTSPTFGQQLKIWRQRRRMSQLDLALEAEISTRHLSFVETGRSQPSREMVLHLAGQLDVPFREQNQLLVAAGFAPVFAERDLSDPDMEAARKAIDLVLSGHEPNPAIAVDRYWNLNAGNRIVPLFLEGVPEELLAPPVNVARLSLHPGGLASRILNYRQWRAHFVERLRRQVDVSADPLLIDLLEEVNEYPYPEDRNRRRVPTELGGIAIPFQLDSAYGVLNTYTTTTVFGSPVDITLQELAIESFFPADAHTARVLREYANAIGEP